MLKRSTKGNISGKRNLNGNSEIVIGNQQEYSLCFLSPDIPTTGINTVLDTLNRVYSCNQPNTGWFQRLGN
jgi:hypothetical protein